MNSTITQDNTDFYQENGYFIKEDYLSPDEVARWITTLKEAIDDRGGRVFAHKDIQDQNSTNNKEPDDFYSKVFVQRVNLWQDNAAVKDLVFDPAIGKMCGMLADVEGLRLIGDQALYKAPWANPTSWHLDNPFWAFHSKDAISIWIALDDATPENGCLFLLPGTHKKGDFTTVPIDMNMATAFEVHPEFKTISSVSAAMKAGSCVFFNGLTLHGAGANMTSRWRRAVTCTYMPIGSTYNGQPNIYTPEQLEHLKVGDVLDDDKQNPIVFQRSAAT